MMVALDEEKGRRDGRRNREKSFEVRARRVLVTTADEAAHLHALVLETDEKAAIAAEEGARVAARDRSKKHREDVAMAAAVRCQSAYRGCVARKFVKAKLKQRRAAIRLQCLSRQFVAKITVGRLREATHAEPCLQLRDHAVALLHDVFCALRKCARTRACAAAAPP